jgi:nitronate monooxygenase
MDNAPNWPDRRLLDLLDLDHPIIQAPMAGAGGSALASAVCGAGGLGSLPCAILDGAQIQAEIDRLRQHTNRPFNLNFFCHQPAPHDAAKLAAWQARLAPYYAAEGLDPATTAAAPNRAPFDNASCALVEQLRPAVVSFHFGLPDSDLLDRVKASGAKILSSATTVREARWLAERGVDAIIAQGNEAGGHRGMFLDTDISAQPGVFALIPQVVDAVDVPVIGAGGIADGRGIAAALALGAAGVQIGTAFLMSPEALISPIHRQALAAADDAQTQVTNLFSGRPARGLRNKIMRELGPMSDDAPAFPTAGGSLAPLKAAAEKHGRGDFSSLWSGQAAALAVPAPAAEVIERLCRETAERFGFLVPHRDD